MKLRTVSRFFWRNSWHEVGDEFETDPVKAVQMISEGLAVKSEEVGVNNATPIPEMVEVKQKKRKIFKKKNK